MHLKPSVSSAYLVRAELTLSRIGTCMAWQWMCPEFCGYVLGICSDRADIAARAAQHLAWHGGP